MTESFAELFEKSPAAATLRPGDIVQGTIIAMNEEVAVVSAGLKSESIIPIRQFYNDQGNLEITVGDEVELALDAVEDGTGETLLSRERAIRIKVWNDLEKEFNDGNNIQGIITDRVRGGYKVNVRGERAFLPGSLVDISPVRDLSYLIGKEEDFKIIKLDRRRRNLVVSRRAVFGNQDRAERLKTLEEGTVVKGVVKNLTDYGAFVDLGGIDGLLHVTDMAWRRVRNPTEEVKVGDELQVKLLKVDIEKGRVSLGKKQLQEDPWVGIPERYKAGQRLSGKITHIAEYGCFVELEEGVEGLVHISEMDWTNKNVSPSKVVQQGEEVEIEVLDVDTNRRRISLGIKQCRANPWESFAATHQRNDKVSGKIKAITDFGVFLGMENGIDGLVHCSDLSWTSSGETMLKEYENRRGETVEAVVLSVDTARERISLGIKQMEEDPLVNYLAENKTGSLVEGTITETNSRGVKLELQEGIFGMIKTSELNKLKESGADLPPAEKGQRLKGKVKSLDRKKRLVILSVKDCLEQEQKEVLEEYRNGGPAASKLGDHF